MDVVIFAKHLSINRGGAERSLAEVKSLFPDERLVAVGCDPVSLHSPKGGLCPGYKYVRWVSYIPLPRFPYVEYLLNEARVRASLREMASDSLLITQGMWAPAAIAGFDGKVVYFIRDEYSLNIRRNYYRGVRRVARAVYGASESLAYALYCRKNAAAVKKAGLVITSSAAHAREVRRVFGRVAYVVYPPIDVLGLLQHSLVAHGRQYITMVGDTQQKGVEVFLQIARRLPHLSFAVVSRTRAGWQSSNVRYVPWQQDPMQVYERTRLLLVPSLWSEAFGRVAIEARALGIPVLVSSSGGLPETAASPEYVVEDPWDIDSWVDRIQWVLGHYEKHTRIAREGLERFDKRIQLAKLSDLFVTELGIRM